MSSRPGEAQVYSPARKHRGILINRLPKARNALKPPRSSCSILPALTFFQMFSFLLSPEYLPSDCTSDCLVVFVCLPTGGSSCRSPPPTVCLSTCLFLSAAYRCLMKPTTREKGDHGRRESKRGEGTKSRGFSNSKSRSKVLER